MSKTIYIAQRSDLPEILKLQYEAFGRVAKSINNPNLPSLKQTLEHLEKNFQKSIVLKYCIDGRIIGSIRGNMETDNICHIGALIVASDFQNMGIGSALMRAIESQFPLSLKFTLFTSPHTPNTSYLYTKLGYKEISRGDVNGTAMIFMEKENNQSTSD